MVPDSTYQNQSICLLNSLLIGLSLRLYSFCYLHLIDKFWLIFLLIIQISVKHTEKFMKIFSMQLSHHSIQNKNLNFNSIQDGLLAWLLTDGSGKKAFPLSKICHTYPTMMKLSTVTPYPKKIQNICGSRDVSQNPLSSADISIFSPELGKICYIKKYRYRLYFDT